MVNASLHHRIISHASQKRLKMEDQQLELSLGFRILDLPDKIIFDVLANLPFQSILRCRCVCKAFRSLLTDPYFAQLYLSRAPTSFVLCQSFNLSACLYCMDLDASCFTASLSSSSCLGRLHDHSSGPTASLSRTTVGLPNHHRQQRALDNGGLKKLIQLNHKVELVNSCNGFLCLYSGSPTLPKYFVCNPILGELETLPPPPSPKSGGQYLGYSGFGFCPKAKRYRIVRFVLQSNKMVAEVYTLGKQSWRIIENTASNSNSKPRGPSFDPFVNGALHWITDSSRSSELIYSFDMDSKKFQPVLPPSHLGNDYVKKISWINVGALGSSLSLCYAFEGAIFEVWVMNDYGVRDSWTKRFAIDVSSYCGLRLENYRPIGFMSNGDMWLACNSGSLVSYSPRKRSFKDINMHGIRSKIQAVPHIRSFVSLRDAFRGKGLEFRNIKPGE